MGVDSISNGKSPALPPLRKPPTLKDVAREAGVSIAAASYALNGGGTIGVELRTRIRDVAERLGYRPNQSARSVRMGRAATIGLVLPDLRNPYYPVLAQAIEHAARKAGYTVVLIDTSGLVEDELDGVRHLEDQGVAAVIWCRTSSEGQIDQGAFSMPVVMIGAPSVHFDNVTINDRKGGRMLARHLLARGHRRFGVLTGAPVPEGKDERKMGFIEAVGTEGEIVWQATTPFSIELTDQAVAALARREITALMCGNDLIAIGALRAAQALSIPVPGELSVVGFDDIAWASIVTPAITTVRQPISEIAAAALTLLFDRLEEPHRPVRHFKLDVQVIPRDSVAAL